MCGSARKDSRSRTDKLLSAISLNLNGGTDNLTRYVLMIDATAAIMAAADLDAAAAGGVD
jgi:hypothetical protein